MRVVFVEGDVDSETQKVFPDDGVFLHSNLRGSLEE